MSIDLAGYDTVSELERGSVLLAGRRGIGLLAVEEGIPGVGVGLDAAIPIRTQLAPRTLTEIFSWVDLYPRSVVPASDTGGDWQWSGSKWTPLRDFPYIRLQGSGAVPIATAGNPTPIAVGFNQFAPAITPPFGFWQAVPRFRGVIELTRTAGITVITSKTDLQIGGVSIISVPWANNVVIQHIEFDFWLSGPTTITAIARAAYAPASGVSTSVQTNPTDITVTGIDTLAKGIQIGITDTVANGAVYKLYSVEIIGRA
jgi:hypothetical protein